MSWTLPAQAADQALAPVLERIMWAQVTMAVILVVCALAVLGAALAVYLLVRKAMARIEETKDQILPHVTPVIGRVSTIADDVRAVTAGFKRDADAVHDTVGDLLDRTRTAVDSLEDRVRRFGLVLEVVQEQAEALLIDAASTAHGVQTAARALREEDVEGPKRTKRRRAAPES
jgi:hypothetical protein